MRATAGARTMMPARDGLDRERGARQVTLAGVSRIEGDRGVRGALTLRLVAGQDVEEYVLQATPDDAARLLEFVGEGADAQAWPSSRTWALATLMHT